MLAADQVRNRFLRFFEAKGHRLVKSASLVPEDDPTLLFTTAGMSQFKDAFLGHGRRDYARAASCQKCLRVGDIDRVGRSPFHHTFFEMLGNFSFGDYFKAEAIPWAWELLTTGYAIPESRLQVTVFRDDAEAREIWRKAVGIPDGRIHAMGEADNFWPANAPAEGPNGPCGPCSEIYYDLGPDRGCGNPACSPACPCGRFFEIWNLVFMQFERRDGGILAPLPRQNIDTGMGMERITAVLQGAASSADTDLLAPVLLSTAEALGRPYEPRTEEGARMRRIADHVRALTFCISDGVLPSNEGRGYVLRRLLRRAARDARELGVGRPCLAGIVPAVVAAMGRAYPELRELEGTVRQVLTAEEERFQHALAQGGALLEGLVRDLKFSGASALPGEEAFRLHDTYGFPLDLIEHVLEEERMTVDKAGFEAALLRQRSQSREGSTMKGDVFALGPAQELAKRVPETAFLGYESTAAKAKVMGFLLEDTVVSVLEQGLEGTVVLDRSPFYAESGGQVGDAGVLRGPRGAFRVTDTQRQGGLILHAGRMEEGRLAEGDEAHAEVDRRRRASIMRHHTATHLLHAALKKVLGPHVEQAGSLVAPQLLRFDFRHPRAMTPEEVLKTVNLVNARILRNSRVLKEVKPIAEAKAEGAAALFGEKYGDQVRVVTVGSFSKELCGGTHCRRSGDIGAFWITAERAVGAGVRRIEAVAGARAVVLLRERERALKAVAAALKSPPEEAPKKAAAIMEELREARREIERLRQERLAGGGRGAASGSETVVNGLQVLSQNLGDGVRPDEMRKASDGAKADVLVLGATFEGKAALLVSLSEAAAAKGLDANAIVKAAVGPIAGRGGGRPRFAQAGGARAEGLAEAIRLAERAVGARLA